MNPLDELRSKEPVSWHLDQAHYHIDQVLGYSTLKLDNPADIEQMCLDVFGRIDALRAAMRKVVPQDDM